MEEHIGEDNTLTIRSPITLVDKTLVEDSTAGVNGQCNGEEQLSDFDMNVPNDGEYNEPFENGIVISFKINQKNWNNFLWNL